MFSNSSTFKEGILKSGDEAKTKSLCYVSSIARKHVFWFLTRPNTDDSKRLEISDLGNRGIVSYQHSV